MAGRLVANASLKWLTHDTAAGWLGVAPQTVRRWLADGILTGRKGKQPSVDANSVVAVLAKGGAEVVKQQRRSRVPLRPLAVAETADEGWLTAAQAAARLRKSAETVRVKVRRGVLAGRVVHVGVRRRVWVEEASLEALMEETR